MVEDKIKDLFDTKTILHIDNPDHYDLIMPHTGLTQNHRKKNNGNFCINMYKNCTEKLDFYKSLARFKNWKFITSTELLGNKIFELW